ncbi:hypothetical protein Tco_0595803 [Tanacetum coccineum]
MEGEDGAVSWFNAGVQVGVGGRTLPQRLRGDHWVVNVDVVELEIPGWVPEFADEFDDDRVSEEGLRRHCYSSIVYQIPPVFSVLMGFPLHLEDIGKGKEALMIVYIALISWRKLSYEQEDGLNNYNGFLKMDDALCAQLQNAGLEMSQPRRCSSFYMVLSFLSQAATKMSKHDENGGSGILKEELNRIDADIDKGLASDIIINRRMEVIKSIQYLDKIHVMDLAQKAKVKWAIEGDENSRYFHGVLNKKRSQSNIRGLMRAVRWDFLEDVPKIVRFCNISGDDLVFKSCLRSSEGSISYNESTEEFQFFKGLKKVLLEGLILMKVREVERSKVINTAVILCLLKWAMANLRKLGDDILALATASLCEDLFHRFYFRERNSKQAQFTEEAYGIASLRSCLIVY